MGGEGPRACAVAVADMVGYTILMEVAPAATHSAWMRLLTGTLRPLAEAWGCRFLKSTGDGVTVEFAEALAAQGWALAVQQAVQAQDRPEAPPIAFRIGLDAGRVVTEGEDIYGACVNIATRLQEHAPPGGLAMTEAVRAALDPDPGLVPIGPLSLRNIATPVEAFIRHPATPPRVPRRSPPAGRPSIAVMPFEGAAAGDVEAYFADGIVDDIVLSLAALRDLSVIARGATLGWRAGPHDPCAIGRILGVRFVLTGSVKRAGGGLRLAARLAETEGGEEIWQDRFEVAERDIFALQDELAARAVAGIAPSIRAAELRRALRKPPGSLTSYDHTLRAMHALDGLQRARFETAEHHLTAAMREDPAYAVPAAWAAQWHSLAVGQAWSRDPAADAASVQALAARAVQLDPNNALGHAISGHYRAYHLRDPASALPHLDRAVQVGPGHALAWALRSASLSYLGRAAEALPAAQHGYALSPLGADRYYFQFFVGLAQHVSGDHAGAVRSMRLSLADSPGFTSAHRILIAALDALGDAAAARGAAAQMLACEPGFRVSRYAAERQPFADPALADQLLGALSRSGVPT
ncbi:adenylate/guanylate cyclase domain-containing protein [Falsiroseomonas sp.]|uniref:adenylate/guanylate cyclase domain-containing protein n=1 Tax=Falsiroseomonas sp. TaxID=2870721 RepID=UPI003F6F9441